MTLTARTCQQTGPAVIDHMFATTRTYTVNSSGLCTDARQADRLRFTCRDLQSSTSVLTVTPELQTTAKMSYENSVYLAKLAEQAERYEGISCFQDHAARNR